MACSATSDVCINGRRHTRALVAKRSAETATSQALRRWELSVKNWLDGIICAKLHLVCMRHLVQFLVESNQHVFIGHWTFWWRVEYCTSINPPVRSSQSCSIFDCTMHSVPFMYTYHFRLQNQIILPFALSRNFARWHLLVASLNSIHMIHPLLRSGLLSFVTLL